MIEILQEKIKTKNLYYVFFHSNDSFCANTNPKLLNKYVKNENTSIVLIDCNSKFFISKILIESANKYEFIYYKPDINVKEYTFWKLLIKVYKDIYDFSLKNLNLNIFGFLMQDFFPINNIQDRIESYIYNRKSYGRPIQSLIEDKKNLWCFGYECMIFDFKNMKDNHQDFMFSNNDYNIHGLGITGDSYSSFYNKYNISDYNFSVTCQEYNDEKLFNNLYNFYEIYDKMFIRRLIQEAKEQQYSIKLKNKYIRRVLNKFLK